MTKKNVRIAGVVMPVIIAMLLLVAGSSRVTASDQPSAANAAVKIDNFVFGPQAITVPVGTTVTWTNGDDIPHTAVSTDGVCLSPRRWTRTTNSLTRLPRQERIPATARYIRK
jgi:plastocyanin